MRLYIRNIYNRLNKCPLTLKAFHIWYLPGTFDRNSNIQHLVVEAFWKLKY